MSDPIQLPKACGCHHLTVNGGITCTQGGSSYRCSACLRQERDEMAAERDEARRIARECYQYLGPGLIVLETGEPYHKAYPWLAGEEG